MEKLIGLGHRVTNSGVRVGQISLKLTAMKKKTEDFFFGGGDFNFWPKYTPIDGGIYSNKKN